MRRSTIDDAQPLPSHHRRVRSSRDVHTSTHARTITPFDVIRDMPRLTFDHNDHDIDEEEDTLDSDEPMTYRRLLNYPTAYPHRHVRVGSTRVR